MRWSIAVVAGVGCASQARICPSGTHLVSAASEAGRVEACAATGADETLAGVPPPGRTYEGMLGMAPPPATQRLDGPFAHYHPNGALESRGSYAASRPDGVWSFWYADGTRRGVGRFERGRPVGCFATWDEHGAEATGVVEGDRLRVATCDPPASAPAPRPTKRGRGDATLAALAQGGAFGASNPTQRAADPAARMAIEGTVRQQLGPLRVGPALGLRMSDSDDVKAYTAELVAGYARPLARRLDGELAVGAGVAYLDVTAHRDDLGGVAHPAFWQAVGTLRAGLSFAAAPSFALVAGVRLDGSPARDVDQELAYCPPQCRSFVPETWHLGGTTYGVDVGVRLLLR